MANVNEGERWTLWVCANGACDPSSLPGVCRCRTEPRPGIISYAERVVIEVGPTEARREAERRLADVRLSMVTLRREHAHAWEEVDRVTRLRDLGAKVIVDTEEALREAKAEVARLREALGRFGGHRDDCDVIAGAPDCNCGFDEAYVRVRQAARCSESEPKTGAYHFAARITPRLGWSWVLVGELDRVVARSDARYATRELALDAILEIRRLFSEAPIEPKTGDAG